MAEINGFKFGKIANNPDAGNSTDIAPAIEMGISNAPTRLIVKYITDMYSYPLEAAIRETVSNAIDAATKTGFGLDGVHAEIVPADEGEIGSRSAFRVIDKGPGMTPEKLVNVYTQYGVSDKRDDEDATGAFGLGAKSPLAYTTEFHIVTKTAEGECHYVHCYRTPSDDFLADPPVKVDGKAVVADNLAVLRGAEGATIEVEDPFAVGETGTSVSFPLSYGDANKARAILDCVDRLFHHTGQGSITGAEYDAAPQFYNIGTYEIADGDGDKVDASIYLIDSAAADNRTRSTGRNALPQVIRSIFNTDMGLTTDMVCFKVGDWLYPANGSAWSYSDYTRTCDFPYHAAVLIDVPSKALPFIPSRDTVRSDSGNANVEAIRAFAENKIREAVLDSGKFAGMFNWFSEGVAFGQAVARCFPMRDYTFDAGKLEQGVFAAESVFAAATVPHTVTAKLEDLLTFGVSVAEAVSTPCALIGYAESNSSKVLKMKYGPVMTTANMTAKVIGTDARYSTSSPSAVGYGLVKSKKVLDGITDGGCQIVQDDAVFAAKDLSKRVANIAAAGGMTGTFPAGIGIVNAYPAIGTDKDSALVIIDGSKHGVSKIRTGINRVFENNGLACDVAMFAIIPPKADGAKWDKDELDGFVSTLKAIGDGMFGETVYIPAYKVVSALAKAEGPGVSKAERSELDKTFNTNRVCVMVDEDAVSYYGAIRTTRSSHPALGADIIGNPSEWGVIVADKEDNDAPYEVAGKYAEASFALGLVPDGIKNVACIGSNHYNAKRAALLKAQGIAVLYDESGITERAGVPVEVTAGTFKYTGGSVVYTGDVPAEIAAYKDHQKNTNSAEAIARIWNTKLTGGYSWRYTLPLDVSDMVELFTFGHDVYDRRETASSVRGWVADIVNGIRMDYEGKAGSDMEALCNRLGDVLEIWRRRFEASAASVDLNQLTEKTAPNLREMARNLGIDYDLAAYYDNGVPLDDILA